ncbi:TPA: hypothetical protein ACFU2V_002316 [Neisseria subflava]|jgi:hypothetical protein|uniref:hypothetical protein n=1 Tax=Neisseria flavescens TaxID=484 RepID=UPI000ABC5D51|nr:hypothetical protein [Neisseria flavescens]
MAKVTYEEFYFVPDDENLNIDVIDGYFQENGNIGKYDKNMRCPECKIPHLKYTPRGETHRSYLSAIDINLHKAGCAHRYDVSSTRNTKAYFESLSDDQVADKLAAMQRALNRTNTTNGNSGASNLQRPVDNPFILVTDNKGDQIRRSLPRRNLNNPLNKEDADLLCAFYARYAHLKVEIETRTRNNEAYNLHYLHIYTTNGKQYRIYRGTYEDKVFPEKSYDVLLIGKFSEKTLPFRSQRINLIERNTKYGNRPNHYAIIIVET